MHAATASNRARKKTPEQKRAAKLKRHVDRLNGATAGARDARVGNHRTPNGWSERSCSYKRGYAEGITDAFNIQAAAEAATEAARPATGPAA